MPVPPLAKREDVWITGIREVAAGLRVGNGC
jgi:hypothetical protein